MAVQTVQPRVSSCKFTIRQYSSQTNKFLSICRCTVVWIHCLCVYKHRYEFEYEKTLVAEMAKMTAFVKEWPRGVLKEPNSARTMVTNYKIYII